MARCGGCCSHDLLECQPNETETRSMFVFHWTISEQGQIQYQGKKPVELEVHKSCQCGCKIRPEVNLLCTDKSPYSYIFLLQKGFILTSVLPIKIQSIPKPFNCYLLGLLDVTNANLSPMTTVISSKLSVVGNKKYCFTNHQNIFLFSENVYVIWLN